MTPDRAAIPPVGGPIQIGMVGWEDDGGTSADLADKSNDGSNLVRVQLFVGRTPDRELNHSQAQGYKLLCRLADHCALPAKGTIVYVAVPEGVGLIPGAACIIATVSNNPTAQANAQQGEQCWQVPGAAISMFLRKNAWGIRFRDQSNQSAPDSFIKFDASGLQVVFPFCVLVMDARGIRLRTAAGPYLQLSGIGGLPTPLNALSSYAKLSGGIVKVDGTKVCLGPDSPTTNYVPIATSQLATDVGNTNYLAAVTAAINSLSSAMTTFFGTSPTTGALPVWVNGLQTSLAGAATPAAAATALTPFTATLESATAALSSAVSTLASTMAAVNVTMWSSASVSASIP